MAAPNNKSNNEALQTLFRSFGGEGSQNVTPETIQNLTEKLSELLGEDVVRDAFANGGMGAERFNEEGLPVVEIEEPAPASVPTPAPVNGPALNEPELVPLSSLSPAERERKRQERDRILDLLEAEETLEQRREEERERLEQLEAAQKRKEAAKLEMERLKMARETQKKMGKALLRGMSDNQEGSGRDVKDAKGKEKEDEKPAKKSVSFAGESGTDTQRRGSTQKIDWGDVAIGRLRAANQLPTLLSQNFQDGQLMKSTVVERIPGVGKVNATPVKSEQVDSDDESDIDDDKDSGGDELEVEEFDADFAEQHREVALEYHRKRGKIGEEATAALNSHSHSPEEDVVVESSLKNKPAISGFRASQLSSSYATSQSLDGSILPASGAQTLQRSIRIGKLDSDDKLVGGNGGESDSEPENENVREMIDLLRKGEVYNAGPNGDLHSIPSSSQSQEASATTQTSQLPPFTAPTQPLPSKPKNSQFKVSRSQLRSPSVETETEPSTPITVIERSSPKLPTVDSVVERTNSARQTSSTPGLKSTSLQLPDFSKPMIIESPSFPQDPRSSRRPERPPEIMSARVRESAPKKNEAVEVDTSDDNKPPKKVSRFRAERM